MSALSPPSTPSQIFARLFKEGHSAGKPLVRQNAGAKWQFPARTVIYRAFRASARVTNALEPKITAAPTQVQRSGTSPKNR